MCSNMEKKILNHKQIKEKNVLVHTTKYNFFFFCNSEKNTFSKQFPLFPQIPDFPL